MNLRQQDAIQEGGIATYRLNVADHCEIPLDKESIAALQYNTRITLRIADARIVKVVGLRPGHSFILEAKSPGETTASIIYSTLPKHLTAEDTITPIQGSRIQLKVV